MSAHTIEEATKLFADDIRATDVYQEYRQYLDALKQEPELYAKVNEYRMKTFELQTGATAPDRILEQIDRLEQEYESVIDSPVVSDFLRAELAFCRLMQSINEFITHELNFE
jgi:cell fate (sporulation/competence/biofilm development) regulator YlbF (YheA/YmcA/DUF963 family)